MLFLLQLHGAVFCSCPLLVISFLSWKTTAQKTCMHTQNTQYRNTCEKTTRTARLGNYCMLRLFGLVLNLRHFDLFPSEELPDASSVVLISQSVEENVEGGRGLSQDRSHLQRGAWTEQGCQRLRVHRCVFFAEIQAGTASKVLHFDYCNLLCDCRNLYISNIKDSRLHPLLLRRWILPPYHPELGWDQVGVLHSGIESQNAVGAPAEQHGFKRSVGVELQSVGGGGWEDGINMERNGKWKRKKKSANEDQNPSRVKETVVRRFHYFGASHKPGIMSPPGESVTREPIAVVEGVRMDISLSAFAKPDLTR